MLFWGNVGHTRSSRGRRLPQGVATDAAMATSHTEISEDCVGPCQRQKRDCAMRFQETILERLGKTLRGHDEDITHEPLPQRWVGPDPLPR